MNLINSFRHSSNGHNVDDFERNRNEVVYSYQNNRNPFIDHPEYVELIWGSQNAVYDTIFVYDTTYVTEIVYDTISVTDTLIIDAVLTHLGGPEATVTIKVYPNPAKDHIFIEIPDYDLMTGYALRVIDQVGVAVFETSIEDPLYEINLSDWAGYGMYYLQVIDAGGEVIDIRKILLQ